jgi:hypothetical protein
MTDNKETSTGNWLIGVAIIIGLGIGGAAIQACTEANAAPNRMKEMQSTRVLCPVIDEDGGVAAAAINCGAGGFSTIACANPAGSANIAYIGGSDVTTANGFPICSTGTSCAGSSVAMDTEQGEPYCTTNAASADGGTPMRCLCGW